MDSIRHSSDVGRSYLRHQFSPVIVQHLVDSVTWKICSILIIRNIRLSFIIPASICSQLVERTICQIYQDLGSDYPLAPFGVETLGPWGPSVISLNKTMAMSPVSTIQENGRVPSEHLPATLVNALAKPYKGERCRRLRHPAVGIQFHPSNLTLVILSI